jgi:hypothetical protein
MDIDAKDIDLVARLKRLDAAAQRDVGFGYGALIDRHATRQRRERRRLAFARGTASALVIAMVGVSVWRFDQQPVDSPRAEVESLSADAPASQPRIVRADTYFAVAALEDHIASIDDALNDARLRGGSADVARLERTRALLVDSYASVRYAEMVNANF